MGRAIFISYRRDDTEGEAGRLFDDLVREFGENTVFMDVAGISPGLDFRKAIDDNVAGCGVLLAMIGPTWSTISDSSGQRRLDAASDFVRLEIASALGRNVPVIPVLVHNAKMPHPTELPDNLKDLAYRNSVEITHARWNSDVQLLVEALAQYTRASSTTGAEPVHATVPVQLPPVNPAPSDPGPKKTSKVRLILGVATALILVAAIAFFAFGGHRDSPETPAASQSTGSESPSAGHDEEKPTETPDSSIEGVWTNPSPASHNGLNRLEITFFSNSTVYVSAWGKCEPEDCSWGEQEGKINGKEVTATWTVVTKTEDEERSRVATVTVRPDGNWLSVEIANEFPNRPTVVKSFRFAHER
jgi:hypothetical protein